MTTASKSNDISTHNLPLFMNDEFDFDNNSIVNAAIMVESEITGISVKEFTDTLRLQHLVIRSKLSSFVSADKNKLHKLIE